MRPENDERQSAEVPFTLPQAMRLLDLGLDGLMTFDRDCRYTHWNLAMERIWGMSREDVIGQRAFDLFPFLVEAGEDERYRGTLLGESSQSDQVAFRIPGTGRTGYYGAHYSPLHDEAGTIVGGVALLRDVTERRLREEGRQEAEVRFRSMADVAPVLLWMSETDGLCTFFNQTWRDFTGRTLEEEWGVGWAEGVHFEDFQRCFDTYREAFNARRMFEMDYRLRRKDGEYRWVLDRGRPRYTPDGTFAGFIGSCVDITELKTVERELRRAIELRDDFLAVASHELKTPLTAVQLQLDRLRTAVRRMGPGPEARQRPRPGGVRQPAEMVQEVIEQVERLVSLVDVLLDVSRVASGRLELQKDEADLAAVAAEAVERWRPSAAEVGSTLGLVVSAPVPGRWDALRCRQVIDNLLSNAVKYGAGGAIDVVLESSEDSAQLAVRDHGIGIASSDQQRIFHRFERVGSSRHYGGLGLGLWITREIVQGMGGAIGVDSVEGGGATFHVALPRSSA